MNNTVFWLSEIDNNNEKLCGDKILSLFKIQKCFEINDDIYIPDTFIISSDAFKYFLFYNNIQGKILNLLESIVYKDLQSIYKISKKIEEVIEKAFFPQNIIDQIQEKYLILKKKNKSISFAVRSSSDGEDSLEASFAGQQYSYLNIRTFSDILDKIKLVYASLYSPQSISYRKNNNISILEAVMAICVQAMVRADKGSSGIIFTADPQGCNTTIVSISANYGLGESIVQGISNPDEYLVHKEKLAIIQKNIGTKKKKIIYNKNETKIVSTSLAEYNNFCLSDNDIYQLTIISLKLEKIFGYPLDIEWGKDGLTNLFYILQARPITTIENKIINKFIQYTVCDKDATILASGKSVGKKAVSGKVKIIENINDLYRVEKGDILVTKITDPQWEPAMKIASGIITNLGGRTCHAAIIARELGIPALVGTNDATHKLKNGQVVTISCCQGDIGYIYDGALSINSKNIESENKKKFPTKVMLNINNPSLAFEFSCLPNDGVGLARMEFIINNCIGIHPNVIINYDNLSKKMKKEIDMKIIGYKNPIDFYISKLYEGLATITAAFYPKPVIIRLSDFKTNEYRNLKGGEQYEIVEENPMIGFRGAMRYLASDYQEAFKLEMEAIKRLILNMSFDNVSLLIPFVRTLEEASKIINLLAENGLKRSNKLKIYIMCEVPSNALLAEEFLKYCDGFSIGSNDMTQLVLGIDRDGGKFANNAFDEKNEAVKVILKLAITACKKHKKYIGICGQGPSDNPDFARWLISEGIDSVSVVPDSIFNFYY